MIFCRNCFVSQCPKTSQGNPSVMSFTKIPVAVMFMERGVGELRFPVQIVFSHSAEEIRRGSLL